MEKIKVLHVVHNFLKGGIEGFLYYLLCAQKKDYKLEVHVLCCCEEDEVVNPRIKKLGIPIHYIKIKPSDLDIRKYYKACKLANGFDIVHIHLFLPILCYAMAFSKAKILFTMHGAGSIRRNINLKIRFKEFLLTFFLNNICDGIANNSNFTKEYWIRNSVKNSIYNQTIYNGVFFNNQYDVNAVYKEYPNLKTKKLIGTTCRLIPWKRVDFLIDAYTSIVNHLPDNWDLLIVGEGSELNKLKEKAKQNNAEHRIHFVGYKSNVTDYQAVMNVCVFPSAEEPFGLVAIECLHLGKPVYVMSDGGGLVEIVNKLSHKYIAKDVEDLAAKLLLEANGEKNNLELSIKYSNSFTIEKTENGYWNMYKLIVSKNGK